MCATTSCAVRDVGQFQGPAPEHPDDLASAGTGGANGPNQGAANGDVAANAGEDGAPLGAGAAGSSGGGDSAGTSNGGNAPLRADNICKSGYRYVARPYASAIWANSCVPLIHLQTAMVGTKENPGPACPTLPLTPASGGSSGAGAGGMGMGTSSGAANGGAPSGGTMNGGVTSGGANAATGGAGTGGGGTSSAGAGGMSLGGEGPTGGAGQSSGGEGGVMSGAGG